MAMCARSILFHVLLLAVYFRGSELIGDSDQDWGYITVRPNAHMFWWLYYTTYNNASNYTERPLIIWLQGGPGMSSSGYGNLLEIGPLDANFEVREGSFVENFNVLFVDNPVGVGYSYISNDSTELVTNGKEIGEDLYSFFEIFITEHHSEFKDVPLYVFGESYGGKMATEFVYKLIKKEKKRKTKLCNLKGLALGDAYISPIDYINHYGPMALNLGLVDKRGFTRINEAAKQIQVLIDKKNFKEAAENEDLQASSIYYSSFGFDLHNILAPANASKLPRLWDSKVLLEDLMNGKVKNKLNLTEDVIWKFIQDDVYEALRNDLIKSVTHKIETILNTTNIKIIVYNGILDFIVNTAGTLSWLDNLRWEGQERWLGEDQASLILNEVVEGYSKRSGNLVFYAVLRAGHSVPIDNLPVMNVILQQELLN